MKRRKTLIILGLCGMMISLAGCNKEENSDSAKEKIVAEERWNANVIEEKIEDATMSEYVELGNYKELTLEKGAIEISEEQIEEEIARILSNTQVTNGKVQGGDIVYISYTATSDGVPVVEDFSAGEEVIIGKSDKIKGFDEGIIGMKPGDAKDITLQVPKDYTKNTTLIGKKITYHVVLDTITRAYKELTNEWVKEYTQYDSVKEFYESVKTNMEQAQTLNEQESYEQNMWEQLLKSCTVKQYLNEYVVEIEQQYDTNIENQLSIYEMTMEDYLKEKELTQEEYEQQREKTIQTEVEKKMIVRAIAEKEKFTDHDKEYKELLEQMKQENYLTEDELIAMYGEKQLEEEIMKRRVMDFIISNSK